MGSIRKTLMNLGKSSRLNDWWLSFMPQIAGLIYFCIIFGNLPQDWNLGFKIVLFMIASTGIATLGYFINEAFDVKDDLLSGHANQHQSMSPKKRFGLGTFALLTAFVPWFFLPLNFPLIVLLTLEIVLFMVYSSPPFRLKKTWWAAIVIDSSYAYVIPFYVLLLTFLPAEFLHIEFILLPIALFLIGVRNIIIHQINDLYHDRLAGTVTLPIKIGMRNTINLLLILLITEFIFYCLFLTYFSIEKNQFVLLAIYPLFLLTRVVYFIAKKTPASKIIQSTAFTDLFYQAVFPLSCLILLTPTNPIWWIIFVVHIILFWRTEFTAFTSTLLLACRLTIGRFANHLIYYFFLIFGVNLQKEQKSAFGYLKSRFFGRSI